MATEVYQPPQLIANTTSNYIASYPSAGSVTRTNICLQSEDFGTTWTGQRATILTDAAEDPYGFITADKMKWDGNVTTAGFYQTITVSSGSQLTASVYAKQSEFSRLTVMLGGGGEVRFARVVFRLTNGTVYDTGASTYVLDDYSIVASTNGYYRCSITATCGTDTSVTVYFRMSDTDSYPVTAGSVGDGVFVWGADVKVSDVLSSYIKTTTSSNVSPRLTPEYSDPNNVVFTGDTQFVGRVPVVSVA